MQATVTHAPASGGSSSRYRLVAELGRGGMATVYLAVVAGIGGFNKLQVVKQLRAALANEPEFLRMFLEEARLAARINHPNVVQTYEVGHDGQHHFIAMEYLEGQSLQTICETLERGKASDLTIPMRLRILAESLAGLHHAHELADFDGTPLNVVHRDVSPHNIIVTYDGHVKLLDFGIAKAADSSDDTRTGVMKGKCAYMALERFSGKADRRSDIFSAGAIMWHLLTGERLWKELSDADIFRHLAKGEIPSPRTVDPNIPEALEQICMKAIAGNVEDRYQTAADFQNAIEDYLATVPRVTARDVGVWLGKQFAERRAKIKSIVEAQIKAGKDGPVPTLEPGGSPSRESIAPWAGGGDYLSQREAALARPVAAVSPDAPRRSGRAVRIVGLLAVTLAVGGVVGALVLRERVVEGPTPQRQAKAPTVFGKPSTPLVTLQLRATPANATLYVDDVAVQGNPATMQMVRDGASHKVRAEAAGYVTKREMTVFDSSTVSVEIALDPAPAKPNAPAVAPKPVAGRPGAKPVDKGADKPVDKPADPTPPPTAAPKPEETAAPGTKPKKKPAVAIDTDDPWKK